MKSLTPREIVSELDKYIVGQGDAKRAVAIAIRNRWRRQQLAENLRADVSPKNILMMGPTGVGKTEIARRLAALTGAPFIKVEATKFTEVGYHGRDVESMVRDLVDAAIVMLRGEMSESVRINAESQVEERLLDLLFPGITTNAFNPDEDAETVERAKRNKEKLREQLRSGQFEDKMIELTTEERQTATSAFGQMGMEMDVEMQSLFERMLPAKREVRRTAVREARRILMDQEAEKLLDKTKVTLDAITRVEQSGIIFLDEIDKITSSGKSDGPDVSRQGVQRDLLPIVEGSTVTTKHGPVRTDHILFIAAGAFHSSQPTDLMPELQGRFPIRVELSELTKDDFVRILTEPQHALTRQQVELLKSEGIDVEFSEDAVYEMAEVAYDLNKKTQNIGARRLHTIMEKVFEQINFEAPDMAADPDPSEHRIKITAAYVRERLSGLTKEGKKKGWLL